MPDTGQGSKRDAVRWGLLLAAVAVSGYRLPMTYRNFQQWRASILVDNSAANFYKANFTVNAVGIAVTLIVGVTAFYLLRSRAAQQR